MWIAFKGQVMRNTLCHDISMSMVCFLLWIEFFITNYSNKRPGFAKYSHKWYGIWMIIIVSEFSTESGKRERSGNFEAGSLYETWVHITRMQWIEGLVYPFFGSHKAEIWQIWSRRQILFHSTLWRFRKNLWNLNEKSMKNLLNKCDGQTDGKSGDQTTRRTERHTGRQTDMECL